MMHIVDLTRRDNKHIRIAINSAITSSYHKHKMAAVLAKGNRVVSVGVNQQKTDPNIARKTNRVDKLHAEMHCIGRNRDEDLRGLTIYIVRVTRTGLGLSRPCPLCWEMIRSVGIREVVYSTHTGWVREKVV